MKWKIEFLKLQILSFPPWPSVFPRYSRDIPDVALANCSAVQQNTGRVCIMLHHSHCITSRNVMSIWHTSQQFDTETSTVFCMCVIYYILTQQGIICVVFLFVLVFLSRSVVYGSYWGVDCSITDNLVLLWSSRTTVRYVGNGSDHHQAQRINLFLLAKLVT
jgi:hypothetical protein